MGLAAGVLLAVWGGPCAARGVGPQRNVYGNPASEALQQRCTIPGTSSTIRLYRGGGGATVANGFTLTEQTAGGRERQIWFSDSRPTVFAIACSPGALAVTLGDAATRRTVAFTAAEVHGEMVARPVVIWRGEESRQPRASYGRSSFALGERVFGVPALFGGLALAAWGAAGTRRRA